MAGEALNAQARAVLALMAAGLPAAAVERGVRMLAIDESDDATSIAAKVAEAKAELPVLFSSASAVPVMPSAPGTTAPKPPVPGGGATETEFEIGQRWARERFPHLVKASDSPPPSAA